MLRKVILMYYIQLELLGFLKSGLVSVVKIRGRWFLWLTDCSGHLDVEDIASVTALLSFVVLIVQPNPASIPHSYLGCRKFRFDSLRSTKLFKHHST